LNDRKSETKKSETREEGESEDLSNIAKIWHQDHPEEVFQCKFRYGGLEDRIVSQQYRIEPFKVCRHAYQNVPEVWP
jgi:hypothetical protein